MAKTPKSKVSKPKRKPPAAKKVKGAIGPIEGEPGGSCCDACAGVETGKWGIPWRDASGTWQCLEGPSSVGSDKRLAADEHGPYWINP